MRRVKRTGILRSIETDPEEDPLSIKAGSAPERLWGDLGSALGLRYTCFGLNLDPQRAALRVVNLAAERKTGRGARIRTEKFGFGDRQFNR